MTYLRLYLAAVALSGCGLINSDVTNFDLTLPDKKFTVDASRWDVDQTSADLLLSQTCSSDAACQSAAMAACPGDCSGTCGASNTCELGLDVGVYQMVDLVTEKPELKEINDRAVIDVSIDAVQYEVSANTLTVETPELGIYVAPMSIMDPSDPMAKKIGTIPAIPAMATVALRDMTFTAEGKAALVDIMSSYKNPFNIIVGSQIVVRQGDQVPSGKLDAVVKIKAHAGL
jgi:hypothetical protein